MNELTSALRQYRHNDGSGFVFGYDKVETKKIFTAQSKMLTEAMTLLAAIEPCVDEWNYPLGINKDIKELCDKFYGVEVRPEE